MFGLFQESIAEFKIERGVQAIASIHAVSWFPMNSYTGGRLNKSIASDVSMSDAKKHVFNDRANFLRRRFLLLNFFLTKKNK